jgi:hypothetical protein
MSTRGLIYTPYDPIFDRGTRLFTVYYKDKFHVCKKMLKFERDFNGDFYFILRGTDKNTLRECSC